MPEKYSLKVSKGISFRRAKEDEIICHVQYRTFWGWSHSVELTKEEWDLIGELMEWKREVAKNGKK